MKLCVLFALIFSLVLLMLRCDTATANTLPDSALSPILGPGSFTWSGPDSEGFYKVTSLTTGVTGYVVPAADGTFARELYFEELYPDEPYGSALPESEIITRARAWLSAYLPSRFRIDELAAGEFTDNAADCGLYSFVFRKQLEDRTIPPSIAVDVDAATGALRGLSVEEEPLSETQLPNALQPPAITAAQASQIAFTTLVAEIATSAGITGEQVQLIADYQQDQIELFYSTSVMNVTPPGRLVWSVRYKRQLPPPANYNDGCPPWRALYVDAMTGAVLSGPPLLAGGSTPGLLGNINPGARQSFAYALAALAVLLLVFLVVKLRKR